MISLNESEKGESTSSMEIIWNCVHNEMLIESIVVAKMSNKNLCVLTLLRLYFVVALDAYVDADNIGGDGDGIDGVVGDQIVDKRNVRTDNIFSVINSFTIFAFLLFFLNRKKSSHYNLFNGTLCLRAIVFYGVCGESIIFFSHIILLLSSLFDDELINP